MIVDGAGTAQQCGELVCWVAVWRVGGGWRAERGGAGGGDEGSTTLSSGFRSALPQNLKANHMCNLNFIEATIKM